MRILFIGFVIRIMKSKIRANVINWLFYRCLILCVPVDCCGSPRMIVWNYREKTVVMYTHVAIHLVVQGGSETKKTARL